MTPLLDLVALTLLPPWRWRSIIVAFREGQTAADILSQESAANAACAATRRRRRPDVEGLRERAAIAVARGERANLRPVTWDDPSYPAALATIFDPPLVLWLRGDAAALDRPAVAIVGSRAGSPYALAAAERLSFDLTVRGMVVVSGLARGVDAAAHRGALAAGGQTVGVLGCGADRIYPGEHRALAADMSDRGVIVSELAPGTPPQPMFFPLRNRIISGLSRAVVVIEANEKSGSLITARCALDQGREVLAVPGSILNGRNRGGHALLRDGAKIVESADDILEELDLSFAAGVSAFAAAAASMPEGGVDSTSNVDPVLACLVPGESCDLDEICERSGLSAACSLTRLIELELDGVVKRLGGGRFVRFDRPC